MSTALEAVLASRVLEAGRAVRRTNLRHTHLADSPLGVVMWRLGGERFRAAAVAWGPLPGPFRLAVAGEPRNRDLYFGSLTQFARDLSSRMRAVAEVKVERRRGSYVDILPEDALQLVVPNRTTVGALGLLGRYLAYLSDRGGVAPDPALVEAGRHLRFYARHARVPGQALIVPLDRLVAEHWATLQSPFEQANLATLDAQIDPPAGVHAFEAAAARENGTHIGPEPTEDIDRVTDGLLAEFNTARAGRTDRSLVGPLLGPLRSHYRRLVEPVWALMERVLERESRLPAAPSVRRRFEADREAFGRHVDWVAGGGRYRTTDTPRQAATTLRRLEEALMRYDAEKAVEDQACMIPYLLDGQAVQGTVADIEERRIKARVKMVRRVFLTLDSDDAVVLPVGKKLWWTRTAHDQPWEVQAVERRSAGSRIVLLLCAAPSMERVPQTGEKCTFATLHTKQDAFHLQLPPDPPWTHRPASPPPNPEPLDAGDAEAPPAPVDGATVADPEVYA